MNIYTVLDEINLLRNRYDVFIGGKSISFLNIYILGFKNAQNRFNIVDDSFPEVSFNNWIALINNLPDSSLNTWHFMILDHCNGDEIKAFDMFFSLLDEFLIVLKNKI